MNDLERIKWELERQKRDRLKELAQRAELERRTDPPGTLMGFDRATGQPLVAQGGGIKPMRSLSNIGTVGDVGRAAGGGFDVGNRRSPVEPRRRQSPLDPKQLCFVVDSTAKMKVFVRNQKTYHEVGTVGDGVLAPAQWHDASWGGRYQPLNAALTSTGPRIQDFVLLLAFVFGVIRFDGENRTVYSALGNGLCPDYRPPNYHLSKQGFFTAVAGRPMEVGIWASSDGVGSEQVTIEHPSSNITTVVQTYQKISPYLTFNTYSNITYLSSDASGTILTSSESSSYSARAIGAYIDLSAKLIIVPDAIVGSGVYSGNKNNTPPYLDERSGTNDQASKNFWHENGTEHLIQLEQVIASSGPSLPVVVGQEFEARSQSAWGTEDLTWVKRAIITPPLPDGGDRFEYAFFQGGNPISPWIRKTQDQRVTFIASFGSFDAKELTIAKQDPTNLTRIIVKKSNTTNPFQNETESVLTMAALPGTEDIDTVYENETDFFRYREAETYLLSVAFDFGSKTKPPKPSGDQSFVMFECVRSGG